MDEIKIALEAINIYQTQYSLVDNLWGYFSVVSLAIMGFVIGSKRATQSLKEPFAIVLAYLVFCYGNHKALVAGQKQLEQLYEITNKLANNVEWIVSSLKPFNHQLVSDFHVSIIVAVALGILAVSWMRYKSHKSTEEERHPSSVVS
ncbi:MAG: hypothetical protein ABFS08_10260 [Pseudomonadota bacterium]